jgi:diacylglycerol O-acyltransferase / wax synthase
MVGKRNIVDRLNPMDALFVDAEDQDPHASMSIGSIAVFDGAAPSHGEFIAHLAERLPLVPRYRQKLRAVPFRLGRPVWVDDPNFDLGYHARRTALPPPGGDEQLSSLMGRVMSQRLDRDHPLWEYWLIEGLARNRWALISKVHHCMVDGISGADLYRVIFDFEPEPSAPATGGLPAPDGSGPGRPGNRPVAAEPSGPQLAAQAALDMVVMPLRGIVALTSSVAANPGRALQQAVDTTRAAGNLARYVRPAPGSTLSGHIGKQRRYRVARASLDDVAAIRRQLGGTVNDVVLAAISGGYRALLLNRGDEPQPHAVPSLIPVSLRAAGEESIYENRISAVVANLPVHIADPVERLAAVREELSTLKASKEAILGAQLITLGRYIPFPLTSQWIRLMFSLPQREIVTVTTNVPGPQQPLYGLGRRLLEIVPYVPIATTLRTGIAVFSYCGGLTFGITGDFTTSPDLEVLARGIEQDVSDLLRAASGGRGHSRKGARSVPTKKRQRRADLGPGRKPVTPGPGRHP